MSRVNLIVTFCPDHRNHGPDLKEKIRYDLFLCLSELKSNIEEQNNRYIRCIQLNYQIYFVKGRDVTLFIMEEIICSIVHLISSDYIYPVYCPWVHGLFIIDYNYTFWMSPFKQISWV